uniref:Metal-dependent protein hydrolase n=1 Tax=Tanacetum cinerariifolium TaxID=118510 RepID=A0A6L2J4Q1_TANCI|nr:metal-dependent protein hydrolase [Tanacetum cinerariifolium]
MNTLLVISQVTQLSLLQGDGLFLSEAQQLKLQNHLLKKSGRRRGSSCYKKGSNQVDPAANFASHFKYLNQRVPDKCVGPFLLKPIKKLLPWLVHPHQPPKYVNNTSLSSRVSRMNINWHDDDQSPEKEDQAFQQAMKLAGDEFMDCINFHAKSWLPGRSVVMECLAKRKNVDSSGEIMLLTRSCPEHMTWQTDYCIMKEGMSILRGWKSVPRMNNSEREKERAYYSVFT